MLIIPAIDIKGGRCVRLVQGDFERETVYFENPVDAAKMWADSGAKRIHLVDLDGAVDGVTVNLPVIESIAKSIDVPVEVGGGIRDVESLKRLFDIGVGYGILGTVAIERPEMVAEAVGVFGDRIIVGIDAKDGMAAVRGWMTVTEKRAVDLGREMVELGVGTIIYTDIKRDGMLKGPNLKEIERMALESGASVIASGGITSINDLVELKGLEGEGVAGAIIGKALYTGCMDIKDAIRVARG